MNEKKHEYDQLQNMHIYQLWERDLDKFLEVLSEYEAKEEKDRQAHGQANHEGKGKRKVNKKKVDTNKNATSPAA